MVVIKTLKYDVRDLEGNIKTDSTVSLHVREVESGAKYLVHKVLTVQDALRRQGTVACKTRSEVTGGGKKPWKQKGTGRARSGSSNSPLWRGGGVAFGPKPRTSIKKINNKEKQLAISTTLAKVAQKIIVVEDKLTQVQTPNTKNFFASLNRIAVLAKNETLLLLVPQVNEHIRLASRNIANLQVLQVNTINVKELLRARKILITKDALTDLIKSNPV